MDLVSFAAVFCHVKFCRLEHFAAFLRLQLERNCKCAFAAGYAIGIYIFINIHKGVEIIFRLVEGDAFPIVGCKFRINSEFSLKK